MRTLAFLIVACCSHSLVAQDTATVKTNGYTKETQWHGFQQLHFRKAGSDGYLIKPKVALPGNPWIWRARFPGFHAEMDIDLVGKGFHLAYLDVANQFGCPAVIDRAGEFYDYLIDEHQLNPKAVMEGVSRGGLFVYNWTARHPDRVACIYCDTPVMDFRSWPGGKGTGVGHPASWQACLKAYGLTSEEAETYDKLPINYAGIIAEAKIPVMHIVSENDRVVPPTENTSVLRDRLAALGHEMQVIVVAQGTEKSNGHHFTHPDPDRVVKFILQNGK